MTKRHFFKSLMSLAATVALAPEIAFGVKLKMPEIPKGQLIGYLMMAWSDWSHVALTKASKEQQSRADFEKEMLGIKDQYDFLEGYKANTWSIQIEPLF